MEHIERPTFENEVFKRTRPRPDALLAYGFTQSGCLYELTRGFMDGFCAQIRVGADGLVVGKVIDTEMDEEYVNFRIQGQSGAFVGSVREAYGQLLEDIRKNCFERLYFLTEQANRITAQIAARYGDEPEFLWEKYSGYGVFRNKSSQKWYAAILNIDKSKLVDGENGEVEVLNVKLGSEHVPQYLQKAGFYTAYHMDKKHWVSILLDGSVTDEELLACLHASYALTEKKERK